MLEAPTEKMGFDMMIKDGQVDKRRQNQLRIIPGERNKSSRNEMKLCEDFLWNKRGFFGAKTHKRGARGWAQPTRACPPLLACPGGLYPPGVVPTWWPRRPQP
ncbi:hypothetical protein ACQJBY_002511 [Aegilops geniculata]